MAEACAEARYEGPSEMGDARVAALIAPAVAQAEKARSAPLGVVAIAGRAVAAPDRPAPPARRPGAAVVAAAAAAGLLLLGALLAPWLAPTAPDVIDLASRRAAPSAADWFGTDDLGRDVLTRMLYGARVSLGVGVLSAVLTSALGTGIGAAAGYAGRWIDAVLMRIADGLLAVPRLPLLMIASLILRPSVPLLIALVGVVGWMETARVVRAEVLSLARRGFVEAARATGARPLGTVVRHVLPNVAPTIAVSTTLSVGRAILLESALSFFGVGFSRPRPAGGTCCTSAVDEHRAGSPLSGRRSGLGGDRQHPRQTRRQAGSAPSGWLPPGPVRFAGELGRDAVGFRRLMLRDVSTA